MPIRIRSFHWEQDFELVRSFLIETYNLTRTLANWLPIRFENRKFGPCGTEYLDEEDDLVKIWEEVNETTQSSKIVAVTVLESGFRYSINIHPDYRIIEEDILHWIEEHVKNSTSKETAFRLQNGTVSTFTPYTTSETKDFVKGENITINGENFIINLEPSSITTFVSE